MNLSCLFKLAKALMKAGAPDKAEYLLKETLEATNVYHGPYSGPAGLVLLELYSFYEDTGHQSQADQCWRQIRKLIMARGATLSD